MKKTKHTEEKIIGTVKRLEKRQVNSGCSEANSGRGHKTILLDPAEVSYIERRAR
jgi:hypothetical protein